MIEIPAHLHDVDATLTAYGRWAQDRPAFGRCGSAEGCYRSTDVHHGVRAPVVLIPDFSGAEINRSLLQLPGFHRELLQAWYVRSRRQQARLRILRKSIPKSDWPNVLFDALTMFRNVHRNTHEQVSV